MCKMIGGIRLTCQSSISILHCFDIVLRTIRRSARREASKWNLAVARSSFNA